MGPSACILFKPSDFPRQLEVSPSAGPAFPTPAEGSTCRPSDAISATVSCHLIVPELAATLQKSPLLGMFGRHRAKDLHSPLLGKKNSGDHSYRLSGANFLPSLLRACSRYPQRPHPLSPLRPAHSRPVF